MSTRFHIGAQGLRGNIAAYAKRFDLLEVRADTSSPTPVALRRWRKAVPPHFEFCVVAGPELAKLKASPALDRELAQAVEMITALQARCFLLPTPVEVTPEHAVARSARALARAPPARRDLDRLGAARRLGARRTPRSPRRNGASCCRWTRRVDRPARAGELRAAARARRTHSFGESALQRVVRAIGNRRDAYVVLETTSALTEAKTLRRLSRRGGRA